jgi:VanZ family protein
MIKKNKFTIFTALVIVYLSLAGSLTFGQGAIINIPYIDKIGHFCLYFILMAVVILEHQESFKNTRQLILVALVPFLFGNLMELLQMTLTANRKAEILDALANTAGITTALFLWLLFKPYYKQDLKK